MNKNNQKNPKTKVILKRKNSAGGPGMSNRFWMNMATTFLVFLLIIGLYSIVNNSSNKPEEISLSTLASDISAGRVESILVEGETLRATYKEMMSTGSGAGNGVGTGPGTTTPGGAVGANTSDTQNVVKVSQKESGLGLTETLANYGVTPAQLSAVSIEVKGASGFGFWLINLAPILIPILFIVFFIWFMTRQVRGAGMQAFSFGQSKARMISPDDKKQRVTFKDVAGVKEAKEELKEIVDFLKNPKKFLDIGARIPKGVLLMGAPGTGKTLLARAVAGEAGVSFFSISGSEFVEMFVGVGASRVRDLFKVAKQAAPAIIFMDEIDAVGRVRGVGAGGGNDEREQTLNQILVEMDGFEPTEKVIVMAATNRPDVLDPALLRPGRFDRRVTLDLPDRNDRLEILRVHSTEKPFGEDVNLEVIAERTPGFSGADLFSLMNEGAILAARENRTKVSQYDLIRSIEKVMLGPERKSHILTKKEKEITAYHEAGHALIASVLEYADPVHKISIISRGRAAGYTLKLPLEDRKLQSKKEFLADIAVSLGGYVVEKMVFDDLTTGSSNDLQVSTALARDMVTRYGMSDKIGPMALESSRGRTMFGQGIEGADYSEKISSEVDAEVSRIMSEAFTIANDIVTKHRKVLDEISHKLIEVETVERKEFEDILIANGITPKKKLDIEHSERA
jgi:cell division protease FtsH